MQQEIYQHIELAVASGRPFAVATVIAVRGSSSAKPGSKALIDADGRNVFGWVGGGCADAYVRSQALEAMAAGASRIVQADLDDEVFGLGMPCGGVMDVFIDPQTPAPTLVIPIAEALRGVAQELAYRLGIVLAPLPAADGNVPELIVSLASGLARLRGKSGSSMGSRSMASRDAGRRPQAPSCLILCGASRITEELARLGVLLHWPVVVYSANPDAGNYPEGVQLKQAGAGFRSVVIPDDAAVVVASHHKGDPEYIEKALAAGACYVGLVASRKRAVLVTESLADLGLGADFLTPLKAPAGLDIGCPTPTDIALSIIAEIIETTLTP